jgi:hypothetical protein
MIFPLYFVGHINCDSDRLGKFRIGYSEFLTLKDFGERYAALNFLEFELVEIEIEYKIKQ